MNTIIFIILCLVIIVCLLEFSKKRSISKKIEVSCIFPNYDDSIHLKDIQQSKIRDALRTDLGIENFIINGYSAKVIENGTIPYIVSLERCSCSDFIHNNLPCKHMYFLAFRTMRTTAKDILLDYSPDLEASKPSMQFSCNSSVTLVQSSAAEPAEFEQMESKNFLHAKRYYVRGINPSTKRRKKELIIALSTDNTEEIVSRSVMLPPYEVEEYIDNPTWAQVDAAYKHDYSFPPDATSYDASVIIGRSVDGKLRAQPPLPEKYVRYFVAKKIFVPKYADISDAIRIYINNIPLEEFIAYFIMYVCNSVQRKNYYFLCDASDDEVKMYFQIAEKLKDNNDFMKSFLCWKDKQIDIDKITISKNTNAYKIAVSYLCK